MSREKLQRDRPTEVYILGLIHDPHASAAKFFEDPIVRYSLADHVDYRIDWC